VNDRLAALGNQLVEVHIWLRAELAALREDVDAYLGQGAARPLLAHRLTFCSAVTRHHTGEDGEVFPLLAKEFPQLRDVIEKLSNDHRVVADALTKLERLLGNATREAADRIRAELDTVAALLETHFTYEERKLVSVLNSLPADQLGVRVDELR
jgi:hemerythrin-like domain-containing protein